MKLSMAYLFSRTGIARAVNDVLSHGEPCVRVVSFRASLFLYIHFTGRRINYKLVEGPSIDPMTLDLINVEVETRWKEFCENDFACHAIRRDARKYYDF